MLTGTVIWFKLDHGFIRRDDGGNDVFVYQENIHMEGYRTLDRDDRVEFEMGVSPTNGKPQAIEVRVLRKAQVA